MERYSRRGFSVAGPALWSSLPVRIRQLVNKPGLFRKEPKHFYLNSDQLRRLCGSTSLRGAISSVRYYYSGCLRTVRPTALRQQIYAQQTEHNQEKPKSSHVHQYQHASAVCTGFHTPLACYFRWSKLLQGFPPK